MNSNDRSSGSLIVMSLLLGAIAVAALPLAAGVLIARLIPMVGAPSENFSMWSILHFLWIYPVIFVLAIVLERLAARLFPGSKAGRFVVEDGGLLLLEAAMFMVFFELFLGALVAATISVVFLLALKPLLDRMQQSD